VRDEGSNVRGRTDNAFDVEDHVDCSVCFADAVDANGASVPKLSLLFAVALALVVAAPSAAMAQDDNAQGDAAQNEAAPGDVDDDAERQTPAPQLPVFQLTLGGVGRVGATAGHVWNIPAIGPSMGGGGRLALQMQFHEAWDASVRASVVVGAGEDGSLGFGYSGFARLRWSWLRLPWLRFSSSTHMGLTGFLLVPIPTYGFAHAARLTPLRFGEWFAWYFKLGITTDALLVVPHLSATASTGVVVTLGPVFAELAVHGDGDLLIAVVANQASALAVAELNIGFTF